jgi:hypothetical protein
MRQAESIESVDRSIDRSIDLIDRLAWNLLDDLPHRSRSIDTHNPIPHTTQALMAQARANETKAVAEAERLKCVSRICLFYHCVMMYVSVRGRLSTCFGVVCSPCGSCVCMWCLLPKHRQWIGERDKIKAEEAVHPMLGQLIR